MKLSKKECISPISLYAKVSKGCVCWGGVGGYQSIKNKSEFAP